MTLTMALTGCTTPATPKATQTQDLPQTHPTPTPLTGNDLYEHAKQLYLEIKAERNKIEAQGGADELPEPLQQRMTGDYEQYILAIAKHWKSEGLVRLSDPSPIVWIKRHDVVKDGSIVAINECSDGKSTKTRQKDGRITTGSIATNQVYFKYFDGELLAFASTYEWVDKC